MKCVGAQQLPDSVGCASLFTLESIWVCGESLERNRSVWEERLVLGVTLQPVGFLGPLGSQHHLQITCANREAHTSVLRARPGRLHSWTEVWSEAFMAETPATRWHP